MQFVLVLQRTCYATMLHEEVPINTKRVLTSNCTFWDSTAALELLYQQIGQIEVFPKKVVASICLLQN